MIDGTRLWSKLKDLVGAPRLATLPQTVATHQTLPGNQTDTISSQMSDTMPDTIPDTIPDTGPDALPDDGNLPAGPPDQAELDRITDDLITAFKTVYDPEIPVDIYELGLIYKVDIDDARKVSIDMTLTAPGCPVAGEMPGWVEAAARKVRGCADVTVRMVFDPPWSPARMSDEAKLELNML